MNKYVKFVDKWDRLMNVIWPIPEKESKPLPYYVFEIKGEWIEMRMERGGEIVTGRSKDYSKLYNKLLKQLEEKETGC